MLQHNPRAISECTYRNSRASTRHVAGVALLLPRCGVHEVHKSHSKFEQEHAKLLSEKAEDENVRYQKMLEKAKLDLEEFYAERQKRTEAARKENRCVLLRASL